MAKVLTKETNEQQVVVKVKSSKSGKLTKAQIDINKQALDKDIKEFIELNESLKVIDKKVAALKAKIESQYTLPANTKEFLKGFEFFAEKITVKGKNGYDMDALSTLLKAAKKYSAVVEVKKVTVTTINENVLKALIKDNVLPAEAVEKTRKYKYTFKSKFDTIDKLVEVSTTSEKEKNEALK
jgi:hypothetical protein